MGLRPDVSQSPACGGPRADRAGLARRALEEGSSWAFLWPRGFPRVNHGQEKVWGTRNDALELARGHILKLLLLSRIAGAARGSVGDLAVCRRTPQVEIALSNECANGAEQPLWTSRWPLLSSTTTRDPAARNSAEPREENWQRGGGAMWGINGSARTHRFSVREHKRPTNNSDAFGAILTGACFKRTARVSRYFDAVFSSSNRARHVGSAA